MLKSKQLRLFCSPEQVCQPQWRSLPTSQLPVCVPPTCACEGRNGKTEPSATSSGAKSIITTDECRVELVVHQVVTAKFQDTNSLLGWLTKHKDLLFVEVVVDDRDSHAQRTSYFVEEAGGLSDGVGLPEDGTLWVSKIALDKLSFEVSSASDFCIRAVREKQNDDAPIPGLTSLICSKRPPLPKSNFSANPGQFQSFSEVSDPYLSKNSEKPARLAFPRQEVVGAVRLNVAQDFVRALINDNGKICVPIRQDDGNQGLIWMTVSIHHLQGKKSPTVEWLRHHRTVGLCGHTGAVSCCAISPNEDLVLTLSDDTTGVIWNTAGERVVTLRGHKGKPAGCAFFPSGEKVITASTNEGCIIWSADGNRIATFAGAGLFSVWQDTDRAVIISHSGGGIVWSSTEQQMLQSHMENITACTTFPSGDRILLGSGNGMAGVWSMTGQWLQELHGHTKGITGCAVFPTGDRVATVSEDNTGIIWSLLDGKCQQIAVLKGYPEGIASCHVFPSGAQLATVSQGKLATLWTCTGSELAVLSHDAPIISCSLFPTGRSLITVAQNGMGIVWSSAGERLAVLHGHRTACTSCAVFPSGDWVVTISEDKTGIIWPMAPFFQRHEAAERSLRAV